ncbi:MAG TPA: DedA family protein, partial [Xanthomonadaceae bacterium]|nr:DedA family protein [Xanthomonadaceae bacterium]
PVPFKIFTLASGAVAMPLLPFYAGAIIGRGKRVFLVAGAIKLGGARAEAALRRWIEPVGWIALLLFLALIGWLAWRGTHG